MKSNSNKYALCSDAENWLKTRKADEQKLKEAGVWDPAHEHDSCGVGSVASIDGSERRSVVNAAIEALQSIWHRGAVDADGMTGDGAGFAFGKGNFLLNILRAPGMRMMVVD